MDYSRSLHRLIGIFKFKEEWQFEVTGLSARELFVLEHLSEEQIRFNEFAERHNIKPSTLTGVIDRLERKQLVVRQPGPLDRKAKYLAITELGQNLVRQHIKEDKVFFNNLLGRLDGVEQLCFIKLVDQLTQIDDYTVLCKEENFKV